MLLSLAVSAMQLSPAMVQSVDVAVTGSVGDAVVTGNVGDGSVEVAVTGSVGVTWVLSSRELTRRNRLELDTYKESKMVDFVSFCRSKGSLSEVFNLAQLEGGLVGDREFVRRRWRRRMLGQGPGPKCRVWWALESPKGPNVELGGPLGALKSLNVKLGGPLRAPRLPNVNHTLAKPHLHTSPIIARVTKGVESCIQPLLLRQYESV